MDPVSRRGELDRIIVRLRQDLLRRGQLSLRALRERFAAADRIGDARLDEREFEAALRAMGLFLSVHELHVLFRCFDASKDGFVSFPEFLAALRGEMDERRRQLVLRVFRDADADGSGRLTVANIASMYDATHHPKVAAGEWTERQALDDFLANFPRAHDRGISPDEFLEYYADISAAIRDDERFIAAVEGVWRVTETVEDAAAIARLQHMMLERVRVKRHGNETDEAAATRMFKFFDLDDSGRIGKDEFVKVCTLLGVASEERVVSLLFNRFDADKSGAIAYREFVRALESA